MKYRCMVCGKVYDEKLLPIIDNGDGCCTIGSLIEIVGYGPMKWDKDEYGDHVQYSIVENNEPITIKDVFEFMHKTYTIKDLEEAFNAGCDLVADSEGYHIEADVDYDDFEDWLKKHKDSDKKTDV